MQALSERDEKTVLVLFGDHLPTLGLKDEDLHNGFIYSKLNMLFGTTLVLKKIIKI